MLLSETLYNSELWAYFPNYYSELKMHLVPIQHKGINIKIFFTNTFNLNCALFRLTQEYLMIFSLIKCSQTQNSLKQATEKMMCDF